MATVEIGYVARAHGVRGELKIATHDPDSQTLASAEGVIIAGRIYPVARARPSNRFWIVSLEGIGDRDAAEALRGQAVEVAREAIELDEGEVILADLIGSEVVLPDGSPWGRVAAIDPGPQDRLVIWDGDVERLLPFVPALVLEVDLEAGRIVVAPPEGWPESPR